MQQFADKYGRKWDVSIDAITLKRVRELTGFDLLRIVEDEGKPLYELRDNIELLVNVVYAICRSQIEAYRWREPYPGFLGGVLWKFGIGRDISERADEAFGKSLGGDSLEHAWNAIITEMIAFFPSGRRRILARAAILAGLAELLDEKTKLETLGPLPQNSGANCSRWRAVSACCRGLSRLASFGCWTRHATSKQLGSSAVNSAYTITNSTFGN